MNRNSSGNENRKCVSHGYRKKIYLIFSRSFFSINTELELNDNHSFVFFLLKMDFN